MSTVTPGELTLRERKKLRTREALIDTALRRFTAQGFDDTTLDELCAEVEISKRTFFRYFATKEDVATAPTQDMWALFLSGLGSRRLPRGGPLMELLGRELLATVEEMPAGGWAEHAVLSCRLAAATPSMSAHSLQFCDRTTRAALAVLRERFGFDPRDLRPRLALDLLVAAFHCALEEWTARPGPASREGLAACLREALSAVPGAVTLEVADRQGPGGG
ncbi:TetR family transcriptional regulator [Planomonospora alba]|uniref:TetR family transcriptional regulator n=1 Tax=Planomonospora alba TaxID=161354 RepID=A0ABP6N1J5_9ACTN